MNEPAIVSRTAAVDLAPTLTERLLAALSTQFSEHTARELTCVTDTSTVERSWQRALLAPLSDFLSRPGKALRATLVEVSYRAAGGRGACPIELGLVVEALHAGSLVVDDIQDGATERRGRPALHQVFGVPLSLNAGNWLYFWAFDLASRLGLEPEIELAVQRRLSRTMLACHYGQALDLEARIDELEQARVPALVEAATRLKTGCLMELAAALGALAAGAEPPVVLALSEFGLELGMALQMLDDYGSLVGKGRSHKALEDLREGRPTWPWAWLARSLPHGAFAALQHQARRASHDPREVEALRAALESALGAAGRSYVAEHDRAALARLASRLGPARALGEAAALVRELEQSYG